MNNSIVSLLQNLGKENSVEVIADFMKRNPEIKDLVAAKMGFTQASPSVTLTASTLQKRLTPRIPNPYAAALSGSHKLIRITHLYFHNVGCHHLDSLSSMIEMPDTIYAGRRKFIKTDLEEIMRIRAEAEEAGVANKLDSYEIPCMAHHPTQKMPMNTAKDLALYGSHEELEKLIAPLKFL